MTAQDKATLKSYFDTGDVPTSEQLKDLIDSIPDINDLWIINPMTDPGDMIIGGTSGVPSKLAFGPDGYILKSNSGIPIWAEEYNPSLEYYLKLDASNGPIINDLTINGVTIGHGLGDKSNNTLVGSGMQHITTAESNTAIGDVALSELLTGWFNTAVGRYALNLNQEGSNNTAIGYYALLNSLGDYNTACGTDSLIKNVSGSRNIGLGHQGLGQNIDGNDSIGIGYQAGMKQADGTTALETTHGSIYIGADSKGFDNNDVNSIVIGYQAIGLGANTTVIGNSSTIRSKLFGVINAEQKTPASATDTGTQGDVCWDADYAYFCVATDTWKRTPISTWS